MAISQEQIKELSDFLCNRSNEARDISRESESLASKNYHEGRADAFEAARLHLTLTELDS
jgi:hypothetical protein